MFNLSDIMQSAQGGNAYNNLAQQFGIAPDQAQQAVEAVLPAISMGLQQQAQTMEGWQNILSSLAQGQNSAELFDSDGDGIPDNLEGQGQNALGAMFGAPEVSEAVATQAAQFAGLPASMMQQMLPMIASMVLGGLFKGAMGNGLGGLLGQMMQGGQSSAGGMGGLGSILGGMLGQGMAPQQQPQAGGMGGVFGNILGQVMGGGQPQAQTQPQGGGLGGMFGNILGQVMGGGQQQAAPSPAADPMSAGLDMLKGMFETGKEVHGTQSDALQQIFGQFTQRK